MRRNRISTLTERPDVPRTPFVRLKPPNGVGGGTQEHAYNLNDNSSMGLYNTIIHKNNLFLRLETTFNC